MESGTAGGDTPVEFECPICKDVFLDPIYLPCRHAFCRSCVSEALRTRSHCPVCRGPSDGPVTPARDVVQRMESTSGTCAECRSVVFFSQMRHHAQRHCSVLRVARPSPAGPAVTVEGVPVMTFQCPYCEEAGLDELDLLDHCNENHLRDTRRVVCPICSALPHGDPTYQSRNFIGHLILRHGFYMEDFMPAHADAATSLNLFILYKG
ncbi:E3 ubiquitin-protein ligase RNF166 isoform X2 [Lepisosteus oculatus]|uniref:E3 ubiquitin-protein ligase RNF166 isoform X2 n=1 Tax=Lepisosteus oculatus TaxID=7918 RepID=UPI0037160252